MVYGPNEPLYTRYVPSQNKGLYFKPHPNRQKRVRAQIRGQYFELMTNMAHFVLRVCPVAPNLEAQGANVL